MSQQNEEELLRKDYLLGKVNEKTRDEVEERLIDDDEFFENLSITEDKLIDEYVFGSLSESERKSFEENFVVNDERHRKLKFAQSVNLYLDRRDESQSPYWWMTTQRLLRSYKFWIAVPAIGILLLVAPRVVTWLQPINMVPSNRATIERRISELNKGINNPGLPAHDLVLDASSVLRDEGGIERVTLPPNVKLLHLKLKLTPSSTSNYHVLLSTVEGIELFAIDDLKRENDGGAEVVHLQIPTEFLSTGDYQVQLSDSNAQTAPVRYYFGVIKQ